MKFKQVLLSSALATLLAGAAVLPTTAAETAQTVPTTVECVTGADGTCTVPGVTTVDPAAAFGGYQGADREVVDPATGLPVDNPFSEESYDRVVAGTETTPAQEPEVSTPAEETAPAPETTPEETTPSTDTTDQPNSDTTTTEPTETPDSTPSDENQNQDSATTNPGETQDGATNTENKEDSVDGRADALEN